MRNYIIILTFFSILGCSTYSTGDLNGKWECTIEEDPFELWVSDTLALGYDFENQIMILYRIAYDGNMLTFTNIDPWEGSTWDDKILSLQKDEFELELQNPGNRRVTKYSRTSDELPEISADYNTNFQRYESYMINKKNNY